MTAAEISRRTALKSGLVLAAFGCAASSSARRVGGAAGALPPTLEIRGGRWWDGRAFRERLGFSVGGRLSFRAPSRIDETLDLRGAYIVPPYADAHNHGIGTGSEDRDLAMIAAYLRAGVFYMQSQGNLPFGPADKERLRLNTPGGVDAIFAQGSITGPGGHPMGIIRDRLLPGGYFPGETLDTLRDRRFFEVASEAELRAKWPAIRAAQGDFIKFFLLNSDEHAARRDDPAFFGRRGLDPELAPLVVRLAHADGLRASAHVVNIADFRTALSAGVDIIAHLPAEALLSAGDARRVAQRHVIVITTCAFLARNRRGSPAEARATIDRQKANLTLLRDAGVHIAIGSDDPADPTPGEVEHLRRLGVFSNAELLAMWTEATPRAIFPGRRVGRLEEGYEASFLALNADPLVDLASAQNIRLRYKQGHLLQSEVTRL
jgi:hypothetical protein